MIVVWTIGIVAWMMGILFMVIERMVPVVRVSWDAVDALFPLW